MKILEWKPMQRNSLRGFVSVQLQSGLIIRDITVHFNNRAWIGFPAKPLLNDDGSAQRDQRGKVRYVPILEIQDRPTADRFSNLVIDTLSAEYPGAVA